MNEWQPIETAPRERRDRFSGGGPIIALASPRGYRALGYWGKCRDGREGWINPHDHLVMDYSKSFTHWMPLPEVPK